MHPPGISKTMTSSREGLDLVASHHQRQFPELIDEYRPQFVGWLLLQKIQDGRGLSHAQEASDHIDGGRFHISVRNRCVRPW